MNQEHAERNIRFYKLFKIFSEPLFWGPVLISYIVNVGRMSLADVYVMEAIVVVGMVFAEIYSSAWADLLGRKRSVVIGSALQLLALVIFAFASSPLHIWIVNIVIMVGGAIVSGADEAFLVDTLKDSGRFHELTKVNREINNKVFMMMAFTSVASGYLYAINPHLPMILSLPGVLISFGSTFFLSEVRTVKKSSHKEHFQLIKISVLFVANHKAVKWIIAFMALVSVASKIWFFTYNPYFELTKVDPQYFGWIFFVFNLIAWQASQHACKFEKRFSEKAIIILLVILSSVPVFLIGTIVSQLSIILIFFGHLTRGFKDPFFSRLINEHLDSKNRATVLSIQSASSSIIAAAGLWIFGITLKFISLPSAMQILGVWVLIIGMVLFWQYGKIFSKN